MFVDLLGGRDNGEARLLLRTSSQIAAAINHMTDAAEEACSMSSRRLYVLRNITLARVRDRSENGVIVCGAVRSNFPGFLGYVDINSGQLRILIWNKLLQLLELLPEDHFQCIFYEFC